MAAEKKEIPLDERQWSFPAWLENPLWNGLHSDSVLWYFSESPFYDRMSNNAILNQQLGHNQQLAHILFNRKLLEDRLKTMSGLEFVVSEQPADPSPGGSGVWVIRKQMRRKVSGRDEVTVLNTYHIAEGKIYMAPLAADLLKRSMLSIIASVNNFMAAAAPLPDFSPALGHRYIPPPSNRLKGIESQLSQGSKDTTPLPDAPADNKKLVPSTNISTTNYHDIMLLEESLKITLKYGEEYMDENPVTGQPGEFHLSTTERKDKDKLMIPGAMKGATLTPSAKATPAPPALKTDIPPAKKGNKAEKSPRTPGGLPKPKRRKSSKAAGSGGITPI